MLLTEGVLSGKTDDFGDPITYPLPRINFRNINYLWRNKVLALLKNFKAIDHKKLLEYRNMYPNGFYIDVRYKATYDNPKEREKSKMTFRLLAQYLIRQPIGDNRIIKYDSREKKVKIFYKGELNHETGRRSARRVNIIRSETIDATDTMS